MENISLSPVVNQQNHREGVPQRKRNDLVLQKHYNNLVQYYLVKY